MASLPALLARLDADERVRGRQWERLCVWYLGHDPAYRSLLRRVWLWKEWPGRWGADAGIDLVAEDAECHLWAVQAKAYDPAYIASSRPGMSLSDEEQVREVPRAGLKNRRSPLRSWPRPPQEPSARAGGFGVSGESISAPAGPRCRMNREHSRGTS